MKRRLPLFAPLRLRGRRLAGLFRGFPRHGRRGRRSQTAALLPRFRAHEACLDRLGSAIEREFLALGRCLHRHADLTGALLAQSQQLISANTDEGAGGAIATGAEFVQQMLDFVRESSGQTESVLRGLQQFQTRIRRVLQAEEQVENVLAELRTTQALYRIEAVRLPPEMQAGFAALAAEIPRFDVDVRATFGRHAESLARTSALISATGTQLSQRAATLERDTTGRRARIQDALSRLRAEFADAAGRHRRLGEISQRIDAEARSLVVLLQYQDITRQQMEHVRQTLHELQAAADPRERLRADADAAALSQACRVDAQQTQTIRTELDRVFAGIRTGVDGILAGLRAMDADCWPATAIPSVIAAVNGSAAELQGILHEVHAHVALALANAEEAAEVVAACQGVASDVATAVRATAENIALIALNAQILAAQAGSGGAGLLILAEHTYRVSNDIRLITDRLRQEFAEAHQQLASVTAECAALKQQAGHWRQQLDARGCPARQQLEEYRAATGTALAGLAGLLDQLRQQAAELQGRTTLPEAEARVLDELQSDLGAMADACGELVGASGASSSSSASLQRLEQRYTMASEREAHAAALAARASRAAVRTPVIAAPSRPAAGTPATGEPATPPLETTNAASGDLGDNIELF